MGLRARNYYSKIPLLSNKSNNYEKRTKEKAYLEVRHS